MTLELAWKIAVAIFLAGGAWSYLKRVRGDVNGLGRKVREEKKTDDQRFLAVAFGLLVREDDREERRKIARDLLDANRGR